MSTIPQLLPGFLQAIHSAGCFDYSVKAFAFFLLRLAAPLVAIIAWGVFIGASPLRRTGATGRIRKCLRYALIAYTAAVCISAAIFANNDLSYLRFGLGYQYYLSHEDSRAAANFTKSLERNPGLPQPAKGLMDIYGSGSAGVRLSDIGRLLAGSRDPAVLSRLAGFYAEEGDQSSAAAAYTSSISAGGGLDARMGLISALAAAGRLEEAQAALDAALPLCDTDGAIAELRYRASIVSRQRRDLDASLRLVDEAIARDGECADYLLQKGRILSDLGREEQALSCLSRACAERRVLPEAYALIGRIWYSRKNRANAEDALSRAVYYDNTDALSQVLLMSMSSGAWLPLSSIRPLPPSSLRADPAEVVLERGDSSMVAVELTGAQPDARKAPQAAVLDPYGFGILSTLKTVKPSKEGWSLEIELRAARDDRRNQGRPWTVSAVLFDTVKGWYAQCGIGVRVRPSAGGTGRILYVVSEDLEMTGDFPHVDATPELIDIDPRETRMDLVEKVKTAEAVAARYGVRWSHMVDLGSAVLRDQWAAGQDESGEWKRVEAEVAERRAESLRSGNDIQLHIHAYSIPGNGAARFSLDPGTATIRFTDNAPRTADARGINRAWAYNFVKLGSYDVPESRAGSVFRGIRTLETEMREVDPAYRTIAFRAGEYEFGREAWEVRKSIAALASNGVLVDSDAIEGSQDKKGFRFFGRIGDNAYFTARESVLRKAAAPQDIGVLEVLPVPNREGANYLQPTDGGEEFKRSYDLCMENGRVRDGVFIIMEMYHIGNTNSTGQWDSLDAGYGDWKRMGDHFAFVRRVCPLAEPVTFSQAVETYLDACAPDLVAVRSGEEKTGAGVFEYDIRLLGSEIAVDDAHPHFVSVKPPSYLVGDIRRAELTYKGVVVKRWDAVEGYDDLEFTATSRQGYRLRLFTR